MVVGELSESKIDRHTIQSGKKQQQHPKHDKQRPAWELHNSNGCGFHVLLQLAAKTCTETIGVRASKPGVHRLICLPTLHLANTSRAAGTITAH